MSLSKSFQIFQFNWRASSQVIVFIWILFGLAQACLFLSGIPILYKIALCVLSCIYTAFAINKYGAQTKTQFFTHDATLNCQNEHGITERLEQYQWQDWGFMIVLSAQVNGKNKYWFWLMHQLVPSEKRTLRLLIRADQKIVFAQIPCITTNPVL